MLFFGGADRGDAVGPWEPDRIWIDTAQRLPANLHMGTSSWSVPGWEGILYRNAKSERQLAKFGLKAYAQNPLMSMVGIDRTYYAPIAAEVFKSYSCDVPDDFRFMVKAHNHVTLAQFRDNAGGGGAAGSLNERFLDVDYATEFVIEPALAGLADKLGPIVFQCPPQSVRAMGGPRGFADKLYHFLSRLPEGLIYAVELRNRQLLSQDYGDALFAAGACHCLNVHPGFESLDQQIDQGLHLIGPALVIRWMLRRDLDYGGAVKRYFPFSQLTDPDPSIRELLVKLCQGERGRDIYMTINNKAEGCSPLSLLEFAKTLSSTMT
jgi:uncharacterized protein YecE (DUF72 family)